MAVGTATQPVVRRLTGGERPSRFRALVVAGGTGIGTGTLTYKVLRSGSDDHGDED